MARGTPPKKSPRPAPNPRRRRDEDEAPPGLWGRGGPNIGRHDAEERESMGMKRGGKVCRGMGAAKRGGGYRTT